MPETELAKLNPTEQLEYIVITLRTTKRWMYLIIEEYEKKLEAREEVTKQYAKELIKA